MVGGARAVCSAELELWLERQEAGVGPEGTGAADRTRTRVEARPELGELRESQARRSDGTADIYFLGRGSGGLRDDRDCIGVVSGARGGRSLS